MAWSTAFAGSLGIAVHERDLPEVRRLLAAGVDPNEVTRFRPALMLAVRQLDQAHGLDIALALLEAGAEPVTDVGTVLSWLPDGAPAEELLHAVLLTEPSVDRLWCDLASPEAVVPLAEHGADVHAACQGKPPLLNAVLRGDADTLAALLDAGVAVDQPCQHEGYVRSALHVAAARGWISGLELLVKRGADVNGRIGLYGEVPLRHARSQSWLVEHGALRTAPVTPELWRTAALRPEETDTYLRAVMGNKHTPLVAPWDTVPRDELVQALKRAGGASLQGLQPHHLQQLDAVLACGTGSPLPRFKQLEAVLGPPLEAQRRGVLRTWTWGDTQARGFFGGWSQRVVEVHHGCVEGLEDLIGEPRVAAWVARGAPRDTTGTHDRWADGVWMSIEDSVITGVGMRFETSQGSL